MKKEEPQVRITCSPGVSPAQRDALAQALPNVVIERQLALTTGVVVGTVIVGLAFVARSFFDEFFKQAGHDAYEWAKTKAALIKARKEGRLRTQYHLKTQGIFIHDAPSEDIESRHDSILLAVASVWPRLAADEIQRVKRIAFRYDPSVRSYVEARLYDSELQGFANGKEFPTAFKIIELSPKNVTS